MRHRSQLYRSKDLQDAITHKPKRGFELGIFKVRRTLLTQSGDLWIGGVFFRRLNERFITNVGKGAIEPGRLHVPIVPLI